MCIVQAYMSDALGVGAFLESSDGQVVLLKRGEHLAEAPGLWDIPGGHPEPQVTIGYIKYWNHTSWNFDTKALTYLKYTVCPNKNGPTTLFLIISITTWNSEAKIRRQYFARVKFVTLQMCFENMEPAAKRWHHRAVTVTCTLNQIIVLSLLFFVWQILTGSCWAPVTWVKFCWKTDFELGHCESRSLVQRLLFSKSWIGMEPSTAKRICRSVNKSASEHKTGSGKHDQSRWKRTSQKSELICTQEGASGTHASNPQHSWNSIWTEYRQVVCASYCQERFETWCILSSASLGVEWCNSREATSACTGTIASTESAWHEMHLLYRLEIKNIYLNPPVNHQNNLV